MSDHICDKGPLIERMIEQLDQLSEKMDEVVSGQGKITQVILGNGVPGIASMVADHAVRIVAVEVQHVTADTVRSLVRRQAAFMVAAAGLVATLIGVFQWLVPVIKHALVGG